MDVEGGGGAGGDDEQPDSIMGDMEAVFASLGGDEAEPVAEPGEATPAPVEPATEETAEAKEARERDEKGRFASKPKAKEAAAPEVKAKEGVTRDPTPSPAAPPEPPKPAVSDRAPQSWKPAAREKWAALPPEVQQEAIRRERETAVALQEASEAKRHHQAFQEAIAPFQQSLRAQGADPIAMTQSLFQTVHSLAYGTPQAKAQIAAQIIRNYGVDIDTLAAALEGKAPQGQPQQFDPQQLAQQIEQRVLSNFQRQQQEHAVHRAQQELEANADKFEFLDDVRDDMAKLFEAGFAKDYADAYDKAVKLHPEISGVLQQREAAKQAANAKASTQRARNAASSVRTQPAGTPPAHKPGSGSIMDELQAQYEAMQDR